MSQIASAFDRGLSALTRVLGQQSSNTTGLVTVNVLDGAGNITATYPNVAAIAGKERHERMNISGGTQQVVSRRFTLEVSTMPNGARVEQGYQITDWNNVNYVVKSADIEAQKVWNCEVWRKR